MAQNEITCGHVAAGMREDPTWGSSTRTLRRGCTSRSASSSPSSPRRCVGVLHPVENSWIYVPSMLLMSAVKFVIVVMFYMHSSYDHRLFRALFTGPLSSPGSPSSSCSSCSGSRDPVGLLLN